MKITIRKRKLANGNHSLYLDFYEKGERYTENLGLYLIPDNMPNAKRLNADALRRATEIRAERIVAGKVGTKKANTNKVAMKTWMQTYLDHLFLRLKPSTFCHHHTLVDNINTFLKRKRKTMLPIAEFDKQMYKDFLDFLENDYRVQRGQNFYPITASTLFNKQRFLNQMLNAAVREGVIAQNPFHHLDKSEKAKKQNFMREYLTVEEVKLLEETPTHSPRTKGGFLFCCYVGIRLSDLQALTWNDIRYSATGMELCIKQQKTGGVVVVPINKRALRWMPERNGAAGSAKVFDLPDRTTCRVCVKALAKRAGIEKDINFHTSRHTFATLSIFAGNDIYTVKNLLGHKSVKTTQVYADIVMAQKQDAVDLMNGLF